jgi:hypothetical protein
MAAKGTSLLTLADVAKSKNKQIGKVAEVLSRQDGMIRDTPFMEMNEGTKHVETIRSGLPEVYYRKANQPIPASKSTTEERTYGAAHFESKSQIDRMVAARGGRDRIAYNRWNQATGHLQAMAQEHADLLLYGSPDDDTRKVPGLSDIFSTLSTSVETSKQIVDFGGVGNDNTSIWLVYWGENSAFGVYPAGTQAGLKRTDMTPSPDQFVQIHGTDENGNPGTFWGYEEDFEIDHGLVVKDYRQIARVANIDISELATDPTDLLEAMIIASYKIDSEENGTPFWYVNKTIMAYLHIAALNKVSAGGGVRYDNYDGKKVLMFLNKPVRQMDALMVSEDAIS